MGWFSSNTVKPSSSQLEQKSHNPLNIAPQQTSVNQDGLNPNESDINHTLNQIADKDNLIINDATGLVEQMNKSVDNFVAKTPKNLFIIDGEKDVESSIICTEDGVGGKTCLKLQYNSIKLFREMQKLEYFCSLPDDIDATYFECRKIQ